MTLPYQETPATSLDVTNELRDLMAIIAGIFSAAADPMAAAEMVREPKKEPGGSVLIQQTRLALALDSWADQHSVKGLTMFAEELPQFFAGSIANAKEAGLLT